MARIGCRFAAARVFGGAGGLTDVMTDFGRRRSRGSALLTLVVVVAAGLALQTVRHLPGSDAAGTVLYAIAAVLAAAALFPRLRPIAAAAIGGGAALAVEFAQLSALPGLVAERFQPARLVLGGAFDPVDVAFLVLGAGGGWLLLRALGRRGTG